MGFFYGKIMAAILLAESANAFWRVPGSGRVLTTKHGHPQLLKPRTLTAFDTAFDAFSDVLHDVRSHDTSGFAVISDETTFTVTMDLPGVKLADLRVEITGDNKLSIEANRTCVIYPNVKPVQATINGVVVTNGSHTAKPHTTLRRVVQLKQADWESKAINAELSEGVLSVKIPKVDAVKLKSRQIDVLQH
jgi:HSP20 family molecular chaperone IbpA